MHHLIAKPTTKDEENTRAQNPSHGWLLLTAWLGTLLLSKLPLIIARDILGTDIPWIIPAWIGIAVFLFAATYIWTTISPLRGYFIIMGVILLIGFWLDPLIHQTAAWQNFFAGRSQMVTLFGDRILLALGSMVVASVLFLVGVKKRDSFLIVGDLNAPVGGQTSNGKLKLAWSTMGPVMAVLLGGLFFVFLASQTSGWTSNVVLAFTWLPYIFLGAVLNALSEEVSYRAAPLATLLPAVGPSHALWLTSLWFGLGHYYGGIPSGPIGLVQTGLLALLLGRAMLDTRGLVWSWIIHVILDIVIYFFIAVTMV